MVRGSDWQSQDREFKSHWDGAKKFVIVLLSKALKFVIVLLSKALNSNYSVV